MMEAMLTTAAEVVVVAEVLVAAEVAVEATVAVAVAVAVVVVVVAVVAAVVAVDVGADDEIVNTKYILWNHISLKYHISNSVISSKITK